MTISFRSTGSSGLLQPRNEIRKACGLLRSPDAKHIFIFPLSSGSRCSPAVGKNTKEPQKKRLEEARFQDPDDRWLGCLSRSWLARSLGYLDKSATQRHATPVINTAPRASGSSYPSTWPGFKQPTVTSQLGSASTKHIGIAPTPCTLHID